MTNIPTGTGNGPDHMMNQAMEMEGPHAGGQEILEGQIIEGAINTAEHLPQGASPTVSNQEIERNMKAIVPYIPVGSLVGLTDPQRVVETMVKIGNELAKAVDDLKLFVVFDTKAGPAKHIRVEGWQMLNTMLGCTLKEEMVVRHYKSAESSLNGWEATVVVVRNSDGLIIGRGSGFCGRDESKWSGRDEYALRSMAITRACSKAVKNSWGWIVKAAGYEPTPAEEMFDSIDSIPREVVTPEAQTPVKPQVKMDNAAPAKPVAPAAPAAAAAPVAPAQPAQPNNGTTPPAQAPAQPPKVSDLVANYAEAHYKMERAQAMNVIKVAGFGKPDINQMPSYYAALDLYAQLNPNADLNDQSPTSQKNFPTVSQVEEAMKVQAGADPAVAIQ